MHLRPLMGWLGMLLTLLKLAICWFILSLIWSNRNGWASIGVFCLMISDVFDGIIFRKSTPEMQRRLGLFRRAMDAVGDRFCICLVFAVMIQMTNIPLYIYGVELVREVFLISIIGYSWAIHRPIIEPNNASRTATFVVGLTAIAWLNSQRSLSVILVGLAAIIGIFGLWKYCQETVQFLNPKRRM